ncbi:MAG: diguanylate cyclase [Erythrobacter sp.]|jgi:diguanylate cyclase (GGDEF)-like protein|nr:diguanylate cyclase [Erythrobacter sp.]
MGRSLLVPLLTALAWLHAWLAPAPLLAAHDNASGNPSFAPACHSASDLSRGFTDMKARSAWTCSDAGWSADRPVAWLRFEREAWEGEERPRHFFSRIARFESIAFAALDSDGTLRPLVWQEHDGHPFGAGPVFELPLPEIRAETTALLVRIERPHSIPLLTEARLSFRPQAGDWSRIEVMILAFVMGMLILPLFFDLSFFIVLRERFIVLHAAMVLAMMGYVLFGGGLISVFATLPLTFLAIAAPLVWAIGVGVSALFLAAFLEPGAQSPFMRRLTILAGWWAMLVPGFCALQLHATQSFDDRVYFYTFMPVICVITAAVIEGLWRKSRSARFIAVAWAPIVCASIERLLRGLGVYVGPSTLDQAMYIATGFEVIVISLAIADRFLAIRRERDAALTEARMHEELSERDPLTGLMNRRALDVRFEELRRRGFDTFALVDLDRFKQVNDVHGHQTGDAALKACAEALRGDQSRDHLAARLGGEEFVVMLRGKRAIERADALRQAIALRIATEVPGLSFPVTASMGVVEVPTDAVDLMSFDEFYSRADALMYEAKASGRNRILYERLKVFGRPGTARTPDDETQLRSA